ncbi:MAG: UDP-N-acetylglucosamine--N-acetylmuramyl-(pentapeptide) pyrophosphoryl-undecaprenol N-acetylglucosamine transferase [Candidatus Tectimicrobiota bacterium]|nr:MAG: UDP-N-acetylglucosamine--N-acetylmuramyl-(pentapeptide) pyrophosphoryl-undecaprenol N-acetylglucosamine transferase [Candidatus Tectomicrobia bacterium]
MARLRLVIAAGGTGGHVYPGIAVAREFQARVADAEIVFVGRRGGWELDLVRREGFAVHAVRVEPLQGRPRGAQLWALGVLGRGVLQALRLLRRLQPQLVLGAGGYVMAPVVLAAALRRIPRVLLEQNLVPGLTVRWLARYAQLICTSFADTEAFLARAPVLCTGTPVRPEIRALATAALPPLTCRLHVLVCGGSQGAHRINQAVIEALPLLEAYRQQLAFVHQTGPAEVARVRAAYAQRGFEAQVAAFLHDMAACYRWAHLVVCRGGASTLAELTVCGRPAIVVPYPHAADDHQWRNAAALQQHGAAEVIPDGELSGARLAAALAAVLAQPARLLEQAANSRRLGRPEAAAAIVNACLRVIGQ